MAMLSKLRDDLRKSESDLEVEGESDARTQRLVEHVVRELGLGVATGPHPARTGSNRNGAEDLRARSGKPKRPRITLSGRHIAAKTGRLLFHWYRINPMGGFAADRLILGDRAFPVRLDVNKREFNELKGWHPVTLVVRNASNPVRRIEAYVRRAFGSPAIKSLELACENLENTSSLIREFQAQGEFVERPTPPGTPTPKWVRIPGENIDASLRKKSEGTRGPVQAPRAATHATQFDGSALVAKPAPEKAPAGKYGQVRKKSRKGGKGGKGVRKSTGTLIAPSPKVPKAVEICPRCHGGELPHCPQCDGTGFITLYEIGTETVPSAIRSVAATGGSVTAMLGEGARVGRPLPTGDHEAIGRADPLDANCGNQGLRDQGRFGSMPLHDDFDN